MAVTLSANPMRPVAGQRVKLTFAATAGGNYVKLLCADAPPNSALKTKLESDDASRIPVLEGDTRQTHEFVPDAGGTYRFVAQEITKGASAYGGGYGGAPDAYRSETVVGETTLSLSVGSRVTIRVGTQQDRATLVLFVWGATILATTIQQQGEKSPSLIDPSSDKASTAIRVATVAAAAAALAGQDASTARGDLSAAVTDFIDNFNAHIASAAHAATDDANAIDASFRNPASPEALKRSLQECYRKLERHMLNDNANNEGVGSAAWHEVGGSKQADWANKLLALELSDLAGAKTTLADIWRAYESHRASTAVHGSADNTNTLNTLPLLLRVDLEFLREIQKTTPTVPNTANSGVTLLVHGAGGVEG